MKVHNSIHRQRGVVLLFSLIALLILMIGAVALVRSFNSSLATSGSIGFKRDLQIRSEAVVARVLAAARAPSTGLSNPDVAAATVAVPVIKSLNYSAKPLTYTYQGIPDVLLADDATFDAQVGDHALNDIWLPDDQVRLRYVIERQCNAAGKDSVLGSANCIFASTPAIAGGSSDAFLRAEYAAGGHAGAIPVHVVYKLTIRATGPRATQSFYQTTFTL